MSRKPTAEFGFFNLLASPFPGRGSGAPSNRSTRFAIGLLVAALALLALAPSAMGSVSTRYPHTASFGPDGTALTSFGNPDKLAFDQANDKLYVLDRTDSKIHAFDTPALTPPGGNFPLPVTAEGIGAGLRVDNTGGATAGRIYYTGWSLGVLHGFDSTGTALGAPFPISPPEPKALIDVAVDSAGSLFIGNNHVSAKKVLRYAPDGTPLAPVDVSAQGSGRPITVAVDSNDNLYVSTGGSSDLYRYDAPAYTTATPIPTGGFPQALAVDTSSDTLYVVHSDKVLAFDAANGTLLYDFARSIAGASFTGVTVDEGTDTAYVSDTGNDKVYAFGPAQDFADATATLSAVSNLTDVSAEIGATITDNNALSTSWRLETSADGGSTWRTAASGKTAGGQSGVAVSGAATGLDPNTDYRFRVVTNKGTAATTEVASSSLSFKTIAPSPVITDVGAIQVQDTSARLVGTIDPRNTEASYVFQYGTTPALGSSTAPVNIGGGISAITVSQVVGGLAKDTTYFFRVVATNLTGTTTSPSKTFHTRAVPLPPASPGNCPNEAIRVAQGSTYLPDCRAYEMVSPPDKNQGGVDQYFWQEFLTAYSRDGNAAAFCTNSLFGEPTGMAGVLCARQVSRRNPAAGRWDTTSPIPSYCKDDRNGFNTQYIQKVFLSPNLDRAFFGIPESTSCPLPLLDPAAPDQALNLYRQDLTSDPFDFDLVAPEAPESTTNTAVLLGATDDFSHIVFLSRTNQTDPPDSPAPGNFTKIYDWEEEGHGTCVQPGGCLNLVSKDTGNVPFATGSGAASIHSTTGTGVGVVKSAVSSDGNRIYFQNGSGASEEIYMRENNTTTHHVSATECTVACGASQADKLFWANPAGDVALFMSCDKLIDESSASVACGNLTDGGIKLYRWDRDAPPGSRLTDLTADHEPGDGAEPGFQALLGTSTAGDVVYFVARGQLISGESTGAGMKIYRSVWNGGSPTVDYLGPYQPPAAPPSTKTAIRFDDLNTNGKWLPVTPDGRYLMITTTQAIDPAADRDSDNDVYRWDEAGGWLCVSCQLPGDPSTGHVNGVSVENYDDLVTWKPNLAMSGDGRRIFFSTNDALVLEDTNGESGCPIVRRTNHSGSVYACQDIYQWHDGTVSLVTSGTGTDPFILMGSTASGDNVFFITRQKLVGWDVDDASDIYVARTDGGFSEPPAQPPGCEGEACRGQATDPPNIPGAGSRELVHRGNTPPAPNPCNRFSKKAKRKLGAAKRARRKGQAKRARVLRKQGKNLNRRAKRCNRRQAS